MRRAFLLLLLALVAVAYVFRVELVAWVEDLPAAWKSYQAEQRANLVQRYQLAVIDELGKRDDARDLAVAAVLAHESDGGIARRRADALMLKALEKGATDPLILWIAAADCPAGETVCKPDKSRAKLQTVAGDNAAVWLIAAHAAAQGKDDKALRNALTRAARAARYDDMSQAFLGAVLSSFRSVKVAPPPREDDAPRGGADTAYVIPALDLALSAAVPPHQVLLDRCKPERLRGRDDNLRTDCMAYFQLLERTSTSAVGLVAGLKGQMRLLGDGPESANLRQKLRDWHWQSCKSGRLSAEDFENTRSLETYLENWRDRGELGALRARLLEQNIALEAPEDWVPPPAGEPEPEEGE